MSNVNLNPTRSTAWGGSAGGQGTNPTSSVTSAVSSSQLDQTATDNANGTQSSQGAHRHRHHGHRGSGGGASDSSSSAASPAPSSTIEMLASLLGVSQATVIDSLNSGTGIATLLNSAAGGQTSLQGTSPAADAVASSGGVPSSGRPLSTAGQTAAGQTAGQVTDPATLAQLAAVLGISSSALSTGLASNASLSSLLAQSSGLQLDSYL